MTPLERNLDDGYCASCAQLVRANEGYVDLRLVWCAPPRRLGAQIEVYGVVEDLGERLICPTAHADRIHAAENRLRARLLARAQSDEDSPEADSLRRRIDEAPATRETVLQRQAARLARLGLQRCERCAGEGGHREWPGYWCFLCHGQGTVRERY